MNENMTLENEAKFFVFYNIKQVFIIDCVTAPYKKILIQ